MSDVMKVQPFGVLCERALAELETNDSLFGIHRSLFFQPSADDPFTVQDMFGHYLATPIGPAAGPHTQLSQNITSAWLCGGRFIELKTVQIMDELEIPRPCIDMEDEGYNVEWSQELKLDQSAREYVNAWALIHILRRVLGLEAKAPFGTIFNMSVGYNMEGILTPPMQRFMDLMEDASEELAAVHNTIRRQFPQFSDIEFPSRLSNSVTLSTMHGCPPDEIEQIARYLLEERGLHTTVKLNPTLLGKDAVLGILHDDLGFHEIDIPDAVFEHDLKYERAVELIRSLQETASGKGLFFGVKLSNTLAMANHRGQLPGDEMYMSGRPLYPVTMNLFRKLVAEFGGQLNVSYAGGADALNVTDILAAGALPVTAASDLLKPGGYGRFTQYLEQIRSQMTRKGATSLEELAQDKLANLEQAAEQALTASRYKKRYHAFGLPKVDSELDPFDCIIAPCSEQCAVRQDVAEYACWIAQGAYDQAQAVILSRNPLPGVTGYVCTHLCQTRCTRNNYDESVAIRDLKRFAVEHGNASLKPVRDTDYRVAVVGSGPSGLAAAYFLGLNGIKATVFEEREMPGGMLAIAPHFRLPPSVVQGDIDRITGMGAEIKLNHKVAETPEELLDKGYDAVYLACGFQQDASLEIEGIDGAGVHTALRFLETVARGEVPDLGEKVLVIGGGNTAMDAARTAQRLSGSPSTVVYRRTRAEMPAEEEELRDFFDEGNLLEELVSPGRVILVEGRVVALECVRNALGEPDKDGRRRPVAVEGSEFEIEASAIILAIGQKPDVAFLDGSSLSLHGSGAVRTDSATRQTDLEAVYAGGDVTRGPAIIIEACEDGRRAAQAICGQLGLEFLQLPAKLPHLGPDEIIAVKGARTRKVAKHEPALLAVGLRDGFDLVEQTLTEEQARSEATRCLQCSAVCDKCVEVCPNRANYAYSVSPAHLAMPVLACREGALILVGEEPFHIQQERQIIHVDDFCNECGNCETFCVHMGKPYHDKPRLFLVEKDFALEQDNAYFIRRTAAGNLIRRRAGGCETQLLSRNGTLVFNSSEVELKLGSDMRVLETVLKEPFEGTLSLSGVAQMAWLLHGVVESLPFLLKV